MPTKNPRLLVTLEQGLYDWIREKAEQHKISMSLFLRDLIKKEFEDESWFRTKYWQASEKKADEDLASGRYKDFDNVSDLLKDLNS